MIDSFIEDIEESYGKYKGGMLGAIKQRLVNLTQENYDKLYSKLIMEYDMARPPSMKILLDTAHRHGIALNNKIDSYSVSICEHCNKEFSVNSLVCPYCKKLRIYGIVKMQRDRPVWQNQEDARNLKDKLEIEEDWNRRKDENKQQQT